jgi:small GTP-binding protein
MGNPFSYIKKLFSKKEAKVLMLGLDAAGKTTILYQLKLGVTVETIPTMGFVYESIQHKNFKLSVWDVAGQDSLRSLWKHYYQNTKAVIFVVDSSDKTRLDLARNELHNIINDEELKDAVLLLLANKMDLNVLKAEEVANYMEFEKIKNMKKKCLGVTGLTGDGLPQALDWLADNL